MERRIEGAEDYGEAVHGFEHPGEIVVEVGFNGFGMAEVDVAGGAVERDEEAVDSEQITNVIRS
jgi:hypothetical protein